jgi:anti-anti-sigma factor
MAISTDTRLQRIGTARLGAVVTRQGTTSVLQLEGEWDLAARALMREVISQALERRPECLVLELSKLEFVDSTGVHAVIELAKRARGQRFVLVIVPGPPQVQRVFEICGLTDRLPFMRNP